MTSCGLEVFTDLEYADAVRLLPTWNLLLSKPRTDG